MFRFDRPTRGCYSFLVFPFPVGPWRSWERAGNTGTSGLKCYRLRQCFLMSYYVYILQSESTGRYYVGQTEHLEERVRYHQSNYSKANKNRGPWALRHFEEFSDAKRRDE